MKYRINLITRKKDKLLSQVLYFVSSYLRYILVITQIVVIFVFFYKLKTDQEIIDLEEAITQKREIYKIAQPLINDYLLYSYKINQIKNFLDKQEQLKNQLDYLLSQFPKDVFLTEMGYSQNELKITGFTSNPTLIRSFYSELQREKRFNKLNLETIKKSESGYVFSMKLADFK